MKPLMTFGLNTNLCVLQNIVRHHYTDFLPPVLFVPMLGLCIIQSVGPGAPDSDKGGFSLLALVLGYTGHCLAMGIMV